MQKNFDRPSIETFLCYFGFSYANKVKATPNRANFHDSSLCFPNKFLMDWRKDLLLASFERYLMIEHEKWKNEGQGPFGGPLGAPIGALEGQNS